MSDSTTPPAPPDTSAGNGSAHSALCRIRPIIDVRGGTPESMIERIQAMRAIVNAYFEALPNNEAVGRGPAAGTRTHQPLVGPDFVGQK